MKTINSFIKSNYLIFLYAAVSVILELIGVYITVGKFYIRDPRLFICIQAIVVVVAFLIKNNRVRHAYLSIVIAISGVVNLVFIVVYKMTGTFFDFGMLNLRKDAMGIIEEIPIDFNYFLIFSLATIFFLVIGGRYVDTVEKPKTLNIPLGIKTLCIVALLLLNIFTFTSLNADAKDDPNYHNKLYGSEENGYTQLGITSHFLNELYNGLFNSKVELGDTEEIEDFIYNENTIYYGSQMANPNNVDRSEYNVITILGETFEWFSFMQDLEQYSNGHNFGENGEEVLRKLYPNLYWFYDNAQVMTNFHAREKTDISENLSILGSYPTKAYINYDYPKNTIPQTMPNTLKMLDSDILCNSYHNGTTTYYNRNVEHLALGFEKFTASETMEKEYGMTNYISSGERNLDSKMIDSCKEVMFPTDQRFYTYITTITMHGQFSYRENLKEYYDILAENGLELTNGSSDEDKHHDQFVYYAAAAMDMDKAMGIMLNYLRDNNLLDKTIITLFGDHNAYYQGLSNYVKNIYETTDENYTNLYRVPLMIYCPDMNPQKIDKFMCTADIVPTLFDLLGIKFNSNIYFGHSAYSDETSILYSRAYNVFLDDQIYFTFINNPLYLTNEEHLKIAEERAIELYEKLSYCDRIFHNDFFGAEKKYYEKYVNYIKSINK